MITVTCAIIEKEGEILLAQRGPAMSNPLKWEFPGGKLEAGESPETCIVREIEEELGWKIKIIRAEKECVYHGEKSITLLPFVCEITGGEMSLLEHAQVQWVQPEAASGFDLSPADVPVLKQYLTN